MKTLNHILLITLMVVASGCTSLSWRCGSDFEAVHSSCNEVMLRTTHALPMECSNGASAKGKVTGRNGAIGTGHVQTEVAIKCKEK